MGLRVVAWGCLLDGLPERSSARGADEGFLFFILPIPLGMRFRLFSSDNDLLWQAAEGPQRTIYSIARD
ncbi:MAG: hypothetical protein A2Y77_00580 [Planctomycetes bacterium RBG_13_62_9]|nr:MAG: hypothetical protein A2Y77_00580 [Planctomycetes bacterium RBG_13_62_9]